MIVLVYYVVIADLLQYSWFCGVACAARKSLVSSSLHFVSVPHPIRNSEMGLSQRGTMTRVGRAFRPWAFLALPVTACAPQAVDRQSSSASAEKRQSDSPVIMVPNPVSLGRLRPGQNARADVTLKNPGREPQTVARIETSCPCIHFSPESVSLEPGETAKLEVTFDPSGEPDFRGGLAVRVSGYDLKGMEQFQGTVELTVAKEETTPDAGSVPE
jgi:hypothetical protein